MAPQQPGASSMPDDDNNIDSQIPRQPQGPSMNGEGLDLPDASSPTQEQINHVQNFITKVKQEFMTRSKRPFQRLERSISNHFKDIPNIPFHVIPDDQRLDYARVFDQLHRNVTEMDSKFSMFCILLKQEDAIRKLIAIVCAIVLLLPFYFDYVFL
jgi:hypothetical protein